MISSLDLHTEAQDHDVTSTDKEQLLRYLDETRDGILKAVRNLSEKQSSFKPAPDRWSVAEVIEHLALVESFFVRDKPCELREAPAASPYRDPHTADALILEKILNRSTKYPSPNPLSPKARWTPDAALHRFLAHRRQTVSFLESAGGLRGRAANHPGLGSLDGHQWVLSIAAHSERHAKQTLEVKTHPKFPTR